MVRSVTKWNSYFIGSLTVVYFFLKIGASPFGTFNLEHRTMKPKAWQGPTDRTKLRNHGPIPLKNRNIQDQDVCWCVKILRNSLVANNNQNATRLLYSVTKQSIYLEITFLKWMFVSDWPITNCFETETHHPTSTQIRGHSESTRKSFLFKWIVLLRCIFLKGE